MKNDCVFSEEQIEAGTKFLTNLLEAQGLHAMAYAIKKTGRIVTESNKHLLTKEDIQEWNDAIDEYCSNGGEPEDEKLKWRI